MSALRIPVNHPSNKNVPHGAVGRGRAPASYTILVAEDDADIRLMVKTLLELKGYRVVEAGDGQQTIETAQAVLPDLILMDLQLPRLNGFAVTRFVRQNDLLSHVPIVIITGHDPAKHRNLAVAAGCNAYIQKPIDFELLEELLAAFLPVD